MKPWENLKLQPNLLVQHICSLQDLHNKVLRDDARARSCTRLPHSRSTFHRSVRLKMPDGKMMKCQIVVRRKSHKENSRQYNDLSQKGNCQLVFVIHVRECVCVRPYV